jgi:hypothetical protein
VHLGPVEELSCGWTIDRVILKHRVPKKTEKNRLTGLNMLSENKSEIILIENMAFNYLLINYFSLDHRSLHPSLTA